MCYVYIVLPCQLMITPWLTIVSFFFGGGKLTSAFYGWERHSFFAFQCSSFSPSSWRWVCTGSGRLNRKSKACSGRSIQTVSRSEAYYRFSQKFGQYIQSHSSIIYAPPCTCNGLWLLSRMAVFSKRTIVFFCFGSTSFVNRVIIFQCSLQGYRGLNAYASRQSVGSILSGESRGYGG
jgi:hypothetical protein